jgi:hypothetical protein
MISSLLDLGYPIDNCESSTPLYNNNSACVKWCHNMMTKGNHHIKNKENSTWEWVANGTISVSHISGKCNVSNIFTKEITQLPLFKFCSMSGAVVMQSGGPIAWKAGRQERTSLSSCKAEI